MDWIFISTGATILLYVLTALCLSLSDTHTHTLSLSLSLSVLTAIFPGKTGLAGSYIGAKDDGDGDDNRSYKMCKAPVKLSPPTNRHPTFYRPDALPVTQPTASKHWRAHVLTTVVMIMHFAVGRLQTLGKMQASDELTEAQVRQLLFDLDSSYQAFNQLLHSTWTRPFDVHVQARQPHSVVRPSTV